MMLHMGTKHQKAGKRRAEEHKSEVREAITSADATGLIAGEELITEAETMLPATRIGTYIPKPSYEH